MDLKVHQALPVDLGLLVPRALLENEEGKEQRGLQVRQENEVAGDYRGPLVQLARLVKQQKTKETLTMGVR